MGKFNKQQKPRKKTQQHMQWLGEQIKTRK